jgi:hypothetical protein
MMLEDAKEWLNSGDVADIPHPKTGATALHVAAAKGYIKVMRYLYAVLTLLNACFGFLLLLSYISSMAAE